MSKTKPQLPPASLLLLALLVTFEIDLIMYPVLCARHLRNMVDPSYHSFISNLMLSFVYFASYLWSLSLVRFLSSPVLFKYCSLLLELSDDNLVSSIPSALLSIYLSRECTYAHKKEWGKGRERRERIPSTLHAVSVDAGLDVITDLSRNQELDA